MPNIFFISYKCHIYGQKVQPLSYQIIFGKTNKSYDLQLFYELINLLCVCVCVYRNTQHTMIKGRGNDKHTRTQTKHN